MPLPPAPCPPPQAPVPRKRDTAPLPSRSRRDRERAVLLAALMRKHGLVEAAAVDDPAGYDGHATLQRILALAHDFNVFVTSPPRKATLRSLVIEVMTWHADRNSPDYNECDREMCHWCANAAKLVGVPVR